jgi:hypothetical protein
MELYLLTSTTFLSFNLFYTHKHFLFVQQFLLVIALRSTFLSLYPIQQFIRQKQIIIFIY